MQHRFEIFTRNVTPIKNEYFCINFSFSIKVTQLLVLKLELIHHHYTSQYMIWFINSKITAIIIVIHEWKTLLIQHRKEKEKCLTIQGCLICAYTLFFFFWWTYVLILYCLKKKNSSWTFALVMLFFLQNKWEYKIMRMWTCWRLGATVIFFPSVKINIVSCS